jgi:uncharacterized protein (TIGR03435 family)
MALRPTIAVLSLAVIAAPVCIAQTPVKAFVVASVKPNTSMYNAIGNKFGPDSMRWTNAPLKNLIEGAYRLKDYQVVGAPAWTESERWDIDAKSDGPTTMDEKMALLATLLADRFQLKFHRETRDLPVLRLEVAKNGPKLATAKPQDADHRWGTRVDRGLLDMKGADMFGLRDWLSIQLNLPVVNDTGLTGIYDLKLEWAQDDKPSGAAGDTPLALSIFAAIEAELGLKLVATRGPVDVLVIEHVERATGN